MVLQASGIAHALPPVLKIICVANFSKKLTTLLKKMLIVVGCNLSEINVTADQAAAIPVREMKE